MSDMDMCVGCILQDMNSSNCGECSRQYADQYERAQPKPEEKRALVMSYEQYKQMDEILANAAEREVIPLFWACITFADMIVVPEDLKDLMHDGEKYRGLLH